MSTNRTLTKTVEAAVAERHCYACNRHKSTTGGREQRDVRGVLRWRCATCYPKVRRPVGVYPK